jgi:hypothetical protein
LLVVWKFEGAKTLYLGLPAALDTIDTRPVRTHAGASSYKWENFPWLLDKPDSRVLGQILHKMPDAAIFMFRCRHNWEVLIVTDE